MESSSLRKTCWVCLETDDEDQSASWMEPCQCRGSSKWIHQKCLENWIDSKQFGNTSVNVSCPQCNTKYVVVYPSFGIVATIINKIDRATYRACRLMCVGLVICSTYWIAVTYGAITVMEVLGHEEGLNLLRETDPIFLSVGLPAIPGVLVLSRLVKWDNLILRLWRNHSHQIPLIKHFVSPSVSSNGRSPTERLNFTEISSQSRLFCGALVLPTIASLTGSFLFRNMISSLEQTLWGGVTYLAIKGVCKLYLRQKYYLRLCQRRILNYWERPVVQNIPPIHDLGE